MKANYWQKGENLDYTNSGNSKIEANTVIALASMIGVAGTDIAKGETGSVIVAGTFEMTKSSENAISQGALVYYDGTGITEVASTGSGESIVYNTPAGYAAQAAGASDTKILVKLLG